MVVVVAAQRKSMGAIFSDPEEELREREIETVRRIRKLERLIVEQDALVRRTCSGVIADPRLAATHMVGLKSLRENHLRANELLNSIRNAQTRYAANDAGATVNDMLAEVRANDPGRDEEMIATEADVREVESALDALSELPQAPAQLPAPRAVSALDGD